MSRNLAQAAATSTAMNAATDAATGGAQDPLQAEVDRLLVGLRRANELAERFERLWYLRGDALDKALAALQQARAYADQDVVVVRDEDILARKAQQRAVLNELHAAVRAIEQSMKENV